MGRSSRTAFSAAGRAYRDDEIRSALCKADTDCKVQEKRAEILRLGPSFRPQNRFGVSRLF